VNKSFDRKAFSNHFQIQILRMENLLNALDHFLNAHYKSGGGTHLFGDKKEAHGI
jgi:hypothetical protein